MVDGRDRQEGEDGVDDAVVLEKLLDLRHVDVNVGHHDTHEDTNHALRSGRIPNVEEDKEHILVLKLEHVEFGWSVLHDYVGIQHVTEDDLSKKADEEETEQTLTHAKDLDQDREENVELNLDRKRPGPSKAAAKRNKVAQEHEIDGNQLTVVGDTITSHTVRGNDEVANTVAGMLRPGQVRLASHVVENEAENDDGGDEGRVYASEAAPNK